MKNQSRLALQAVSGEAIRTLRMSAGMTVAELASASGISKNTVTNIEQGVTQQMQLANAKRIAKALDVPLEEITKQTVVEVKNPALGALGLVEIPATAPEEEPFQSLQFSRTNQPLGEIWYDYRTETLSLHEAEDPDSGTPLLECRVQGGESFMAGNYRLHPENHTPRQLTSRQQAIGFSARVVANPERRPLSLVVRLVDRKGREWVLGTTKAYGLKDQPHLFALDLAGGWTQCIVHLTPYPTALHTWYLFRATSADRSPNLRPDWSVVAQIVIEIGQVADIGHPAAPESTIWFTPIWVGTPSSLAKRLPRGPAGKSPGSRAKPPKRPRPRSGGKGT